MPARRPPIIVLPGSKTNRLGAGGIELTQAFERNSVPAATGRSRLVPPVVATPTVVAGTSTTTTTIIESTSALTPVNVSAAYTAAANDLVRVDATAGNVSITLPTSSLCQGQIVAIKKTDATTNLVTAVAAGSDTVWAHSGDNPIGFQYDGLLLYAGKDGSGNFGWDSL